MAKLIGGTIGNTPIKNIRDGSAFSAGGAGGGLTPKTLTVNTTATTISGWDKPWTGAFTRPYSGGVKCEKLDDDVHIFVWRSITDNKVKAAIITHDANGDPTFGSQTSLTAFTDSTKGPVWVRKVSSTRVLIMSGVEISTYLTYQIQVYDISGTTITAAAGLSLQSITMQVANYNSSVSNASLTVIDANRALLGTTDYYRTNDSRFYWYGIRFTATQNVGSPVDFGYTGSSNGYREGACRFNYLVSTTKLAIGDTYSVNTIDIDAGSTPTVSNLVEIAYRSGSQILPFGHYQYEDDMKLQVRPDVEADDWEHWNLHNWGFKYFDGLTNCNYPSLFPTPEANQLQPYGADTGFTYLSGSGTVHHMLFTRFGSGANGRYYQTFATDTSDNSVAWGLSLQPATGINSSSTALMGAVIRPKIGATRITAFEYQEATTAGWYYTTFDISD